MKPAWVVIVVAAAAVFGGVWYFAGQSSGAGGKAADAAPAMGGDAATSASTVSAATGPEANPPLAQTPKDANGRPVPADPRLAALMVSPGDALIEYVKDADGRVIQELDNDPNSPRFRQPVREYLYAGGNVAGLTTYRYVGDQVEVVRVMVSYKPDGSVDQYRESIGHEKLRKAGG